MTSGVRTFYVSSALRDNKYSNPNVSEFVYQLPSPVKNVTGVSIRNYKFYRETIVNENNKTLSINIDANQVVGTVVLDKGDYPNVLDLLNMINTKIEVYGVQFSIYENVNRVALTFSSNFVNSYIIIQPSSLLRQLGFPNGIALYRTTPPSGLQFINMYAVSAVAENNYDVLTVGDLVVRINDLETIMSNDPVTNKCTTVLFCSSDPGYTINTNANQYIPLLQTQSRIQSLRISLYNMNGDYYDIKSGDVIFLLDLHCRVDTPNIPPNLLVPTLSVT